MFSFLKYGLSSFENFETHSVIHITPFLVVIAMFFVYLIISIFYIVYMNIPGLKFSFRAIKNSRKKNRRLLKVIIQKRHLLKNCAIIFDSIFPKKVIEKNLMKQRSDAILNLSNSSGNFYFFENFLINSWSNSIIIKICKTFVRRYISNLENAFKINRFLNPFRFNYRIKSKALNDLHNSFSANITEIRFHLSMSRNSGFTYLLNAIQTWIIPVIFGFSTIYYLMVIRCLPFNKTMFVWLVIGMFSYWLISGFVYFIKKYQFSKFTSAIQRFWRRSYILFWLIEFSLFSVFFYLTLNANNESWYMYDQLQVNKTGLFSWRIFILKIYPITFLLLTGYVLLLSLKWNIFSKHILWLFVLTNVLIYVIWSEFYQFFHAVNFYGNFNWVFDADEKVWSLELESRKSRTVNHYVMLMIMLKFWHIVIIFIIWVFFVLRALESSRIRYPIFSANLQNFLILYLFAWVMMFPWLKFMLRKCLDMPYHWFYINNRKSFFRVFFGDLSLYYYSMVDLYSNIFTGLKEFISIEFFYFSVEEGLVSARKASSSNLILSNLIRIV